jgi:hypothetical protein
MFFCDDIEPGLLVAFACAANDKVRVSRLAIEVEVPIRIETNYVVRQFSS